MPICSLFEFRNRNPITITRSLVIFSPRVTKFFAKTTAAAEGDVLGGTDDDVLGEDEGDAIDSSEAKGYVIPPRQLHMLQEMKTIVDEMK